jgi:hypothetical protein
MRIFLAAAFLSTLMASHGTASDVAKASLALSGLTISREKKTKKPESGPSQTVDTVAVDLFGSDGMSALPSLEFAFSLDNIVVYAYPNAPAGGREIRIGLKAGDAAEIGFVAGTNHLAFNPANDLKVKTSYSDRVGVFLNHRVELDDLSFDFNVTPTYTIASKTFSEAGLNQNSGMFSVTASGLWVWELAKNIELSSGLEVNWSQSKEKVGGKTTQSVDSYRLGVKLAETRFYL